VYDLFPQAGLRLLKQLDQAIDVILLWFHRPTLSTGGHSAAAVG
jgi:hypothetical protein